MAKIIKEVERGSYSVDCRMHSFKGGRTLVPSVTLLFADGEEWCFCSLCYDADRAKHPHSNDLNRKKFLNRQK
jgi:hypothetical protein